VPIEEEEEEEEEEEVVKYVDYNYVFRPFSRPSSGCICLSLRVLYNDKKLVYFDDEIQYSQG
jgi:hypothetical protein